MMNRSGYLSSPGTGLATIIIPSPALATESYDEDIIDSDC